MEVKTGSRTKDEAARVDWRQRPIASAPPNAREFADHNDHSLLRKLLYSYSLEASQLRMKHHTRVLKGMSTYSTLGRLTASEN
jgi:hypothetical protein